MFVRVCGKGPRTHARIPDDCSQFLTMGGYLVWGSVAVVGGKVEQCVGDMRQGVVVSDPLSRKVVVVARHDAALVRAPLSRSRLTGCLPVRRRLNLRRRPPQSMQRVCPSREISGPPMMPCRQGSPLLLSFQTSVQSGSGRWLLIALAFLRPCSRAGDVAIDLAVGALGRHHRFVLPLRVELTTRRRGGGVRRPSCPFGTGRAGSGRGPVTLGNALPVTRPATRPVTPWRLGQCRESHLE